jgi:DNA gyrase/topoisomerase IV subunit B
MAALYHLAPEFIKEGRLCWLHSPLYIVTNGTRETYYYTDEEFDKVRSKITGTVTRAKGLGELSPETAKASMFTVGQQRLEVLNYSSEGVELLLNLMGEESELRRDYIVKNIDFSTIKE